MQAQYGSWSLAAACVTILSAQAFHPIMLSALTAGETSAWLAMTLAGLAAALLLLPVARSLTSLPGGNLITLAEAAGGRVAAVLTGLATAAAVVYHAGLVLRQTSEMATSAVFPHTPQTFATATLLIFTLYGALGGTGSIVRLCRGFLLLLVAAIALILAATFGWGELRGLLPIWGPGPGELLVRSIGLTALYTPALFLLAAAGQVRDRKNLWRVLTAAVLSTAIIFAAVKVVLTMTYPFPLGRFVAFPLHEMARLVIGGRYFERIEGIWILVWVFATLCHLSALLHTAAVLFRDAFSLPGHHSAVLPLVAMASAIALFPPDQASAIEWHSGAAPLGLAVAFGLPLALAAAAALRGRLKHGR